MLTYISLFSGIGGFDLGFDRAGMACLAQVEIDPQARALLQYHWPNIHHFEDVRNVGKHNLSTPTVLCGGFPCQDVSVAGKRKGLDGERSGLWFEFLRVARELKPRFVVIENVPGLLSSNEWQDFATVVQGLVECGYCVAYRILDAKYFGVAQRRRRVFIVASLGDGRSAQILFESEGSGGDTEPRFSPREGTPRSAQFSLELYRQQAFGQYVQDETGSALKARDYKDASDLVAFKNDAERVVGTLSASGAGTSRTGNSRSEADMLVVESVDVRNLVTNDEISGTLQSKNNGGYSLNYINPVAYGLRTDITPKWAKNIAPTLLTPSPSGGGHPAEVVTPDLKVRRLTPTECERLQAFPDGWTAVNNQSDSTRYKQLGNAVCVNVAEWLGQRIVEREWLEITR